MQKRPAKLVFWFLIKCAVLYALFVAPIPGVASTYRSAFRAAGNALFFRSGGTALVQFEPLDRGPEGKDTRVVLENRRDRHRGALEIRSLYYGYRPMVFLFALVLATPTTWSRRGRALAWGFVWINLFVALRVWLRVTDAFCDPKMLGLYDVSAVWRSLLHGVMLVLSRAPATAYFVPLMVWGLVTFRRGDWEAITEGRPIGIAPLDSGAEPAARKP